MRALKTAWRSRESPARAYTTKARISSKEKERKRKRNRFFWLSFAFFYFLESGLFNGLWPKKVEKLLPFFHSRVRLQIERLIRARLSVPHRRAGRVRGRVLSIRITIAITPDFGKRIHGSLDPVLTDPACLYFCFSSWTGLGSASEIRKITRRPTAVAARAKFLVAFDASKFAARRPADATASTPARAPGRSFRRSGRHNSQPT